MRELPRSLLLIAVCVGCVYMGGVLFNDPQRNGWTIFLALLFWFGSICAGFSIIKNNKPQIDDPYYLHFDDNDVNSRYNREHRRQLSQGADYWNTWRKAQKIEHPQLDTCEFCFLHNFSDYDLHGAELADAKFKGVNLDNADLSHARLVRTQFEDVGLRNADLSESYLADTVIELTDFSGADFTKARIENVTFQYGTEFTGADFTKAYMGNVTFKGRKFTGVDFSQAEMYDVEFIDSDLSGVKGLDTVKHDSSSMIDFNTINRSKSAIPKAFLRSAGARYSLIDAIHSLKSFEYYSCFISYSSKDEEFATRLHTDLVAKGVRCWFAPHDMKTGDKIRTRIDESILGNDKLLLVLSEHSIGSQWVEQEVETALDKERERKQVVLFPIKLDNMIIETKTGWPAFIRRTRHITNFQHWKNADDYQRTFSRLLQDLIAEDFS
ncbi:MAG: hypothetical protein AUH94_02495 [Ktedonobacter sp. 13_2_20CM_2_54_8]|nr:MAG: hypothetical protein AUH94_02495 [Ktedonobacter sp. 13_2_20CM_2_54_8]